MSEAGKRLIESAQEMLEMARGNTMPAFSIKLGDFTYLYVQEGARIVGPDKLDTYTLAQCAEHFKDVANHYEAGNPFREFFMELAEIILGLADEKGDT